MMRAVTSWSMLAFIWSAAYCLVSIGRYFARK